MEEKAGLDSVRRVKNLIHLTGHYKENDEESKALSLQAQEFVKIKEEEHEKFVKERLSRIEKQLKKEEKYQQKLKEKQKKKVKKHKKIVTQKNIESEEKRKQHLQEREAFKEAIVPNKVYAHNKLEKEYQDKFVIPTLEEKKSKLENLRNFYQPINREEIDEHDKNYHLNLKLKNDEKRLRREQEDRDKGVGVRILDLLNLVMNCNNLLFRIMTQVNTRQRL